MNKTNQVRQYIKTHPGKTNRQVAEALGTSPQMVATATLHDFKKERMVREVVGQTAARVDIYAYYDVENAPAHLLAGLPTRSSAQETVVSSQETVVSRRKTKVKAVKVEGLDALVEQLATTLADQVAAQFKVRLLAQLSGMTLPAVQAPVMPKVSAPVVAPVMPKAEPTTVYGPLTAVPPARPMVIHAPEPAFESAPRKHKVLIVGLLPQQAGMISMEFSDALDLSFWKDESTSQLRNSARAADVVVLFTSKISHSHLETVKSVQTKVKQCPGGMTALRDMLTNIFVEDKHV